MIQTSIIFTFISSSVQCLPSFCGVLLLTLWNSLVRDVCNYVPCTPCLSDRQKDVSIGIGEELLPLKWLARQTHLDTVAIQNKVAIFSLPCCLQLYFIFKKPERVIYAHLIRSFQGIQISSSLPGGCLLSLALFFLFVIERLWQHEPYCIYKHHVFPWYGLQSLPDRTHGRNISR